MLRCEYGVSIQTSDKDPAYQAEILMSCNFFAVIRNQENSIGSLEDKFSVTKVGLLKIEDRDDRHWEDYPEGQRYVLTVRDGEGCEYRIYQTDCFYLEQNAIEESQKRNQEIDEFFQKFSPVLSSETIEYIADVLRNDVDKYEDFKEDLSTNYEKDAATCLEDRAKKYLDMHPENWDLNY